MFFPTLLRRVFALTGIVILSVTSCLTAFAQSSLSISGTVKDSDGAAIGGATVKALNIASGREFTATTDTSGKYSLTDLPAATYRVIASREGFADAAESITVTESVTQDFSLSPGSIQDTITVTAGKGDARVAAETPQTVTVVTETQLEERRPVSTLQALERAPNLITVETNPARARPRLRGLDSTRVLVVIDGERLNNSRTDLNTGLSPGIVDVNQLESAEVVGGSGSSLYGSDSIAGTINLVTKAPSRPDAGTILGLRFDGNFYSQGRVRRGATVLNYASPKLALRLGGSLFCNRNYELGKDPIPLADTIAIGRFYSQFPSNNASQFPIFEVPGGGEILNGPAHGFNDQVDAWYFPSVNHQVRYRQLNSQHYNLGNAFSGPPYETQERFNGYRRLDKNGIRYQGLDFTRWLPRLAVGFYRQKLSFPQDQFDYTIVAGSSFNTITTPPPTRFVFTGNPSRYAFSSYTDNKNTITTKGFDVQATFAPVVGALVTTGFQITRDQSRDNFTRYPFVNNVANVAATLNGASSPDSDYTNKAVFAQAEIDRFKYIRVSGGFRVDNWETEANPTKGFPLGTEAAILAAVVPPLTANPGPLAPQIASLPALTQLAAGAGSVKTDTTRTTGNFGVVFRTPGGVNPYFRVASSYREPSVTERYLIRNFGSPAFSVPVVGNPGLKPETGVNYDIGFKIQTGRLVGSVGYFRNKLSNLIVFATPTQGTICVDANPARGLLASAACGFAATRHPVSFNGRINQASNEIEGYEVTAEYAQSLGDFGSLSPFTSMGWLHGTNDSPTATQISIINSLYNRPDTRIRLKGFADDVPLGNITPFRGIFGVRYNDRKGRIFAEYEARHQTRVTRANPSSFIGPTLVNIGTFLSLNEFTKQAIRGGYSLRRERYRMSFTVGIDNLTDRTYFEHFQTAPGPGRAFIFGITTDFFNLLRK